MQLSISHQQFPLFIRTTSPTVVEPGQTFFLKIEFICEQSIELSSLTLSLPDHVEVISNPLDELLPKTLSANHADVFEIEVRTDAQRETYGLITFSAKYTVSDTTEAQYAKWENWLSSFTREVAPYPEPLSDKLRQRLIDVTNSYLRNAHIFMADFVAYFDDYLNIKIGEDSAAAIAEEMPFSMKGLPLDPETRLAIAQGTMTFYGVDGWLFEADGQCEQCDPIFQTNGVQDVDSGEVEVTT